MCKLNCMTYIMKNEEKNQIWRTQEVYIHVGIKLFFSEQTENYYHPCYLLYLDGGTGNNESPCISAFDTLTVCVLANFINKHT